MYITLIKKKNKQKNVSNTQKNGKQKIYGIFFFLNIRIIYVGIWFKYIYKVTR